ncbi:MAG TPA: GNAT family protein [Candidatus Methylacidiphilales bacterium]|nr:GNAT family protein [Candidatus Methylacidiphilales bacterium]
MDQSKLMPVIPRTPLGRPNFRFEIRPYDFSCVAGLYEAADESRKSVSPWMAWLHGDYSLQDAENWTVHAIYAWKAQTEYEFVIYDREDGKVTGSCGLNRMNAKDKVCNLGYWVRTSKTRLGAATQAASLLKEFGFGPLGLNRLEIVVAEGNHASRGVAKKAGAVYEGIQRNRLCVDERIYNAHMYALIKPATD